MEEHIQVAIGSILGDGNLKQLSKRAKASQLYVSQHSSKLPYLEWLHERLGGGFAMNPIKPKKGYEQHYFMTKPEKGLGYLMEKFYPKGKKIIPDDIGDLLKYSLSLAVWYMDDGTLDRRSKYHYNALIATYGFSFDGCERLSEALHKNFGLEVSVTKCKMRDKVYPRMYVKSNSMVSFISLIKPHIHPIFEYKVKPNRDL